MVRTSRLLGSVALAGAAVVTAGAAQAQTAPVKGQIDTLQQQIELLQQQLQSLRAQVMQTQAGAQSLRRPGHRYSSRSARCFAGDRRRCSYSCTTLAATAMKCPTAADFSSTREASPRAACGASPLSRR